VGRLVRTARAARGWSQDVLADRSGLHRAHIGEIERGEVNVSIQTLYTLAQTLKVRLKDLIPDS
jgi:transcriptional regulator with XRE-family HTH domain